MAVYVMYSREREIMGVFDSLNLAISALPKGSEFHRDISNIKIYFTPFLIEGVKYYRMVKIAEIEISTDTNIF